jgi:hypothetical protein
MEDLIKEASLALSANDAETLERLVRKVRDRQFRPLGKDLTEVARATEVLSAQVNAAYRHLDLISRTHNSVTSTYRANQWVR